MTKLLNLFVCFFALILFNAPAQAQNFPPLTNTEERDLNLIAQEAILSKLEGRPARQPQVGPRLMMAQGLVVSIYIENKLVGRTWRLREPLPLAQGALALTQTALDDPKEPFSALSLDDLEQAVAVATPLDHYQRVADDRQVPPRSAVIVYKGFTEAVGLPGDVPSAEASDLLSFACEMAGLRPGTWMLPDAAIFTATAGRNPQQ